MKILHLVQGTPAWQAARASYYCASDAPVMMGQSSRTSRSDLVRMRATGDEREFSTWMQENLLAKGHAVEAWARKIVEAEIGEELYPVTASDDTDTYLASFDGLTMDEETGWECKLWNEELAAAVRAGEVPESHAWQLESHFLVNEGLRRVLFTVTDGTPEKTITIAYQRRLGGREVLIAGWKQFEEDVKAYVHVEVLPSAVATPTKDLPAIAIKIEGAIELVSNLDVFGERLRGFIGAINRDPRDDQAFADAEHAVKVLKTAEERLEAAESAALAQTATVDDMRKTVAMYRDLARQTRLQLEKLVEAKKSTMRDEIRREGIEAFAGHVTMLNRRLGKPYMPTITADFASAMKGKKTIASLRDAVATELSRAKIAANAAADKIEMNMKFLASDGAGFEFLFADAAQLVQKAADDFQLAVRARIDAHKKALDEKAKAEEEARARASIAATATPVIQPAAAPAAPAPRPTLASGGRVSAVKPPRPTDGDLIAALALHFRVHESQVIAWLLEVDLRAASERIAAKEFAA